MIGKMNEKKFKPIKGYEHYIIYEDGTIYNTKTKKSLKYGKINSTIARVILYKKNINKVGFTVTRLIYETWYNTVLTPKDIIKFKDNNSTNFHYKNLINVNDENKHLNHMPLDDSKEWKIFKDFDNYKISNYGDVFSIKSNKMFDPYLNPDGYYHITLTKDTLPEIFLLHCVVYMTFKGDLPKGKVVDHANRIKTDNFIDNLQEATYSDNALNISPHKPIHNIIHQYSLDNVFIKEWSSIEEINNILHIKNNICACCLGTVPTAHGFIWKYPAKILDISDYVDIVTNDRHTYSKYKINKQGQIINKNNILLQYIIKADYSTLKLKSDINGKFYRHSVHRLVAMTFIPNKNPLYTKVNHIDEDKSNNHVDNLEWCTQKQNAIHSLGRKVNQIDIETNKIINTFPSISEANASLNKRRDSNGVRKACNGTQKTAHGYKWSFV